MTKTIVDQIEDARKRLLDFTLRNRLLNFRATKSRTIRIVNPASMDIYDALVLKEKALSFRASNSSDNSHESTNSLTSVSTQSDTVPENTQQVPLLLPSSSTTHEDNDGNHRSRYLSTLLEPDVLSHRLRIVAQEAKSILEEQGYTVLYIALGFLEWYDATNSSKSLKAPLILIPVELRREEVRDDFRLTWTGSEIMTNISLKEKLKEEGVLLPDFEMPDERSGIGEYFSLVEQAIAKKENWKISPEIYLDFFSFTKFVMYKDLDLSSWPGSLNPSNHPVIKAIFDPDPNISKTPGFSEDEVDEKIKAESVYHILDADSSQIAIIEDIKCGRNLVVQGPPGTGKSQTITNAIADLLAQGKTVLFISEKMAALEVVKKRLDLVGIGDFCLELHSRKATTKSVHQKLLRTLEGSSIRDLSSPNQYGQYESLREDLNRYIRVLNTPIGKRGLTPYILIGQYEKSKKYFATQGRDVIRLPLNNVDIIDEKEWNKSISSLMQFAGVLCRVRPVQQHPWYGCKPGVVLESDLQMIKSMVEETLQAFFDLQKKMEKLAELTGLAFPNNIEELKNAVGATKLFVSPNPVDRNLLLNEAWNEPNRQVAQLIEYISLFQEAQEVILQRFERQILDQNLDAFLKEFPPLSQKFILLRLFDSRYRTLRQNASTYYRDHLQHTDNEILADFANVQKCTALKKQIRQYGPLGRSLVGSLWQDESSSTQQLREFSDWIVQFRKRMLEDIFTARTVEMLSQGVSTQEIEKATTELVTAWQIFLQRKYEIFNRLQFHSEPRFNQTEEQLEFPKYQLLLQIWNKNISTLIDWSHYVNFSEDCRETYAGQLLDLIEEQDLASEDIIPAFEGSYSDEMLRIALQQHPELSRFLGDAHEQKIETFAELDRKLIEINRYRLIWKLRETMPHITNEASPTSDLGILKQQFNRQRGLMPIRQLFKITGNVIQKITPCFMMSPLSVALFLDPRAIKFDVIIFDEASQVKPEDALGALLRGNQAVVIGDSRQLPPTSFFDKMIDDDLEDYEEPSALPSQMESILNLCRVSFPSKTLRWHYRSRHESLIALSNSEFYDDKLFVYPSPQHRVQDIGLKFVHLPGTVYGRGSSQANLDEAQAVAKAVFDHYRRYPTKSLGVGTFNIKQQTAIQDAVEVMRHEHTEMEHFFREDTPENFFVKNLETIQGDERDVIFISVGYGKDSTGTLHRNFGPLNKEGGERRLNVLITRARERCVVFSNFTANDLEVTGESPWGVKVLKLFLAYAESGNLPTPCVASGDSESPFEDAIYDFLVANNYLVHKQIGCAGFRLDMAVVDPEQPGRYLVGIECDGAQYHSSKVARDRDRLRQQILEGLGWKIRRVWSTDWYRNTSDTKRKLLESIEKIKTSPEEAPKPATDEISDLVKVAFNTPHQTLPSEDEQDAIQPYQFCCTSENLSLYSNFSEISPYILENAIVEIVSVEGPLHIEELYLRLKKAVYIPRLTTSIKGGIHRACNSAINKKRMRFDGKFLWPDTGPANILRRRSPTQGTSILWICDEEIGAAIEAVLTRQYATEEGDLIGQVLRIFGFLRSTDQAKEIVRQIIHKKIDAGDIIRRADGKIDVKPVS